MKVSTERYLIRNTSHEYFHIYFYAIYSTLYRPKANYKAFSPTVATLEPQPHGVRTRYIAASGT